MAINNNLLERIISNSRNRRLLYAPYEGALFHLMKSGAYCASCNRYTAEYCAS